MKAISFLEYCKDASMWEVITQEFSSYYNKVSQPFSFEKVVELFEGFDISKMVRDVSHLCLLYKNYIFYFDAVRGESLTEFFFCVELNSIDCVTEITPKTIDEFIVLCKNLNIELEWKNQEV